MDRRHALLAAAALLVLAAATAAGLTGLVLSTLWEDVLYPTVQFVLHAPSALIPG